MEVPKDSELEDFERWDVASLKTFLAKRGVSQKGKKKELVALAYSCNVMNKPSMILTVETYSRLSGITRIYYIFQVALQFQIHLKFIMAGLVKKWMECDCGHQ